MEIKLLKVLVNNISSFFHLSARESINYKPVQKYYQKTEDILKLIKPILDAILDTEVASDEKLQKIFAGLGHAVMELRELFDNWQPLMSKVYFVLQAEPLIAKVRTFGLETFEQLKSVEECIPSELSAASLELCVQKLKNIGMERTSSMIMEAIKDQVEVAGPSSDSMVKIADNLNLKSNQELLIEAVALEKLKENAEQAEKNGEVEEIDQMITLVTHMHEDLILSKQSQSNSPVPIPADFCCPLSLELMTDPVIVASGQTYERAFIRNWIELGLTVCPKTRQTLAHTNLIPNYTVKALIASWCESNNVKLPDPLKSNSLNQTGLLYPHSESSPHRDSPVQSHSRVNRSTSPEPTRSLGSPLRSFPLNGVQQEGSPPSHLRSSSEESLPGETGSGLDIGNMSLGSAEDRLVSSRDRSGQLYGSPSRDSISGADERSSQGHNRTASVSSTVSNSVIGDGNDAPSQAGTYSTDVSGEVSLGSQPTSTTMPQREPEPQSRTEPRPRSQTIWRRPSQNFVPRIVSSPAVETRADLSGLEAQVRSLVEELKSSSVEAQRNATSELRLLAKHNMDNRIVIANCGAIPLLVKLLYSTDIKTQENAVTALLNLSINDNNKTAIANADAIEPLIHVLQTGSPEARENSAATLFSLSVIEENKVKIGRSGAIPPLVDLLGNGTPRGKKDAATALFNLSIFHENKGRIVQAGAVKYLVELMDPAAGMVDKAVAVLSNLATIPEGRTAIGQEGGIPVLVEVVELGSARGKENAAAALLQLCTSSSRFCNMVLQEGAVPPLVALSQSGTPRAREKIFHLEQIKIGFEASGILQKPWLASMGLFEDVCSGFGYTTYTEKCLKETNSQEKAQEMKAVSIDLVRESREFLDAFTELDKTPRRNQMVSMVQGAC
ncbi:OLC1v1011529C1 [Oldenlandia corymbosa var. corymbosa]|nr:OLC1v1011529C1 [Oldenlandia corymbosa var. corymbosa]